MAETTFIIFNPTEGERAAFFESVARCVDTLRKRAKRYIGLFNLRIVYYDHLIPQNGPKIALDRDVEKCSASSEYGTKWSATIEMLYDILNEMGLDDFTTIVR